MTNPYFNATGAPGNGAPGASAAMRAEFQAIAAAFDKLPLLSGNANKFILGNPSGDGLTSSSVLSQSAGGNIGIGTTTPATKLSVISAGDTRITVGTATSVVQLGVDVGNNAVVALNSANKILLSSNGVDRVTIGSGGNVGIGVDPGAFRFSVSIPGTSNFTGALFSQTNNAAVDAAGVVRILSANNNALNFLFNVVNSDGVKFAIRGDGLVQAARGIDAGASADWTLGAAVLSGSTNGTNGRGVSAWNYGATGSAFIARVDNAAVPLAAFYYGASTFVGAITTNATTTSYATSSDIRLKENVVDSSPAGDIIDRLRVVSHDWKAGGHTAYGFIAQELHSTFPDAVTPGDNGDTIVRPWGVDTSFLVPLLVKELQGLRARMASLEFH